MQNDNERDAVHIGGRVLRTIAATMMLLLYGAVLALLALPVLLVVAVRGVARLASAVGEIAPPAIVLEAVAARRLEPAIAGLR